MPTNITKTTQSRVFLTRSKGSPAVAPAFQGCLVLGGVSQGLGDREAIYCQDPYVVGKFKTVGYTESAPDSVESSLSGRFMATARSMLIEVARAAAPVDIHVHVTQIGSNPSVFAGWQSKIIFEGARFSSLDIDELGSHDEDVAVDHSVDFTADNWYQLAPLTFSERGASIALNEIFGTYVHYNGDLEKPPAERVVMFASTKATGGSASTPANLLYSLDAGSTWYDAGDVDVFQVGDDASGVVVVGEYVAVLDSILGNLGSGVMAYAPLTDFDGVNLPTWASVATTDPNGDGTNYTVATVAGSLLYAAGTDFGVAKTSNVAAGFETLGGAAWEQTGETPLAIAAYDEDTVVVVGTNQTIMKCIDGENFELVDGPLAGSAPTESITAVAVLSPRIFIVGTDGAIYYTTNGGTSWTAKSFPGTSNTGVIEDIKFATALVGFMSQTLSGAARLFMTTDGGYSWSLNPTSGVSTISARIRSIGTQRNEPNIVLFGGLAETGSDGALIVGESPVS